MNNINDVNEAGTSCEGLSSGRCSVEVQRRPGPNHATDPKSETSKIKKNKNRKEGGRGKNKQPWSKEERLIVWECYLRSVYQGGRENKDYIKRLMEMWNGRDISVRSQASVISQVECIKRGGLLSEMEKSGIEQRIQNDLFLFQASEEEEEIDFEIQPNTGGIHECEAPSEEQCNSRQSESLVQECNVQIERFDVYKEKNNIRMLDEGEKKVLERIRCIYKEGKTVAIPSLKAKDKTKVFKEVNIVNGLLHNVDIGEVNVTNVNRLLYAGSYVVCERLGLMKKEKVNGHNPKPWWQKRLEMGIKQWRKDVARIMEIKNGVKLKDRIMKDLEKRYKLSERGLRAVTVFLENKIKAASTKIRTYIESNVQLRQNLLYNSNRAQLFQELGGKRKKGDSPNAEEAKKFWYDIWSEEGVYNENAAWLKDIEASFSRVEQQEEIEIDIDDVERGIRRMKNWKAPGPDGVQGFWFKKFSSVRLLLMKSLNKCLTDEEVPEWMVKGRTVLIQKDPAKGSVAGNYRPITCLPLMWKLLTGIFSGKMYEHLNTNGLLFDEQKGCRKGSRGTKDQMLIDKAVLKEARLKHRNVSMVWIDYKKAYDMVPHAWILKVMSLTKVAGNLGSLVRNSMHHWETTLNCNGKDLGNVNIKRGIFQGDSLSPLLFVMSLLPLTLLLRKEEMFSYKMSPFNYSLNHLLFMDDLKLFAQSQRAINELVRVVERFSTDIGMAFGIDKCATINIKEGVRSKMNGIELPSGEVIKEVAEEGYKYLGVLQADDIKHQEMKDLIRKEYLRRVKAVAKSKLYAKNLISSLNAWAVSIIRYSAGILEWREKELQDIDIKTRKILTMNGIFHKKSNVDRLYLKRDCGGRGLICVEDCVKLERNGLKKYMIENVEPFLIGAGMVLCGEIANGDGIESSVEYKERVSTERVERVKEKKVHGKYFSETENVANRRSFDWLSAGRVTKTFEGLIFAAQEQALPTNWLKSRITGEQEDSMCRKCGKEVETVAHLVSACSELCQSEYLTRHNKMGLRVYWQLCHKYNIKCSGKWFEESPEKVRISECGNFEIWWDRAVETQNKVDHNKPDVVVIDRLKRTWTIIDFSVPCDRNIIKKEKEKIENYNPLAYEVRKLHKVTTRIVPIVVGALGAVSSNLQHYLKEIDIPDIVSSLQTSAVIGTAIILRKVLSI